MVCLSKQKNQDLNLMQNDFLYHVAADLYRKYGNDLSEVAVVFPNKRAALYLNEYLVTLAQKPIWSPSYFTEQELFAKLSRYRKADDLKLICELYKSFCTCLGEEYAETLDHFFGWGQILLSDFNDVDKCVGDAEKIFNNLHDLKIYDQVDYLTEEQKETLKAFFSDFSEERLSELKKRFLKLWQNLHAIYQDFNHRLAAQGLCYEGAQYREVAAQPILNLRHKVYAFVGIHAPQKAEQHLFDRLQKDDKAIFYWDYDAYYLPKGDGRDKEAGYFISTLLKDYPNELEDKTLFDNWKKPKEIIYTASPTLSMQARSVGQWLRDHKPRIDSGRRTAIVLCDEKMLPLVTHSIPPEVAHLNITVGYPLSQTPGATFLRLLFHLQVSNKNSYSLKYVKRLLNHPYCKLISKSAPEVLDELVKNRCLYPKINELRRDEGLSLLFEDIDTAQPGEEYPADRNCRVGRWLLRVIRYAAQHNDTDDPLFKESIFRLYTVVNRVQSLLESGELKLDIITYERLIDQIVHATNIPYHGEPVVGLQVMGLLETRNLDFDHLLVLGCNEGNVPKTTDSPTFIPYLLRESFGLTTTRHQTSVYAYHFYRMLQRAKDITLVYCNVSDNTTNGERSRFMSQMLVECGHEIKQEIMQTEDTAFFRSRQPVEKDSEIMQKLQMKTSLSPSAINKYLRCGLLFYYNYVLGIRDNQDELTDEIDHRLFGSIFHDASQFLYDDLTQTDRAQIDPAHPFKDAGKPLPKQVIKAALKDSQCVERALDKSFEQNFFKGVTRVNQHNEYNGLQLLNRKVIYQYLEKLLETDLEAESLTIRGLEGDAFMDISFESNGETKQLKVGGRIDRLDEVGTPENRSIRVVDYKTGSRQPKVSSIEEVFSTDAVENHSDYFLQVMLYSIIVRQSAEINPKGLPVSPALLFIQKTSKEDSDPVISFAGNKSKKQDSVRIDDIKIYAEDFLAKLRSLLSEIFNPAIPFQPTDVVKRCDTCDLKEICGKMEKK